MHQIVHINEIADNTDVPCKLLGSKEGIPKPGNAEDDKITSIIACASEELT
eukprot:m.106278 g.106278  ORF g.106278 m.106278 type:complete len:51 (-) comp15296_c3_seq9:83-235(-)